MKSNIYGYVRVSSKDQNEARQLIALHDFPDPICRIFTDKMSGKDFNRPGYKKLLKIIRPGDVIVIKSIDRLGRNYDEILEQWRLITRDKKAHMVVLDMPLLDTRNSSHNLTGTFIADLVLQILSYVAQTERENIKKRQAEGIAAAKQRGVRFGRQKKTLPDEFPDILELWKDGKLSAREAARRLSVSHPTFLKWAGVYR